MSLEINCQLQRDQFNLEVHLTVAAGAVLAITGENGSGKTSTLDMIAGLLACTTGKILLNGEVLDDSTTNRFMQPREARCVDCVSRWRFVLAHDS